MHFDPSLKHQLIHHELRNVNPDLIQSCFDQGLMLFLSSSDF